VHISGFELKADYDWGRFAGGNWRTNAAYGYTKGTDKSTNKPVDTISPQQLVLACAMTARPLACSSAPRTGGKDRDARSSSGAPSSAHPRRCWIECAMAYPSRPRLNVGIYNLTDKSIRAGRMYVA
jgi:hemoglobin/transferrin/lactoferrin receptor protein